MILSFTKNLHYFGNRVSNTRMQGFSLLELVLYIAILSGLMVVVSNSYISLLKGRGQSQARSEVNAAIRFATELIRQDLKDASAVTTPTLGTPAATLVMTIAGVTNTYSVSAGVLNKCTGVSCPGSGTIVAMTGASIFVNAPTFTMLQNTNTVFSTTTTAIQIAMNFRYNALNPDWTYSTALQTTVSLR